MKNQKIKIKETDNQKSNFTITAEDFFQQCIDYLCELSSQPQDNRRYIEHRNNLLEYYFTYKFFCREFNWKPTVNMKFLEPEILIHLRNKMVDINFVVLNTFDE